MFSASRRRIRSGNNINQENHDGQDHHDRQNHGHGDESPIIRDIHALTPPSSSSHRSSSLSSSTDTAAENFTTISREFNALVLAGSRIRTENESGPSNLVRIGEEETNPLAIVLDRNPLQSPRRDSGRASSAGGSGSGGEAVVGAVSGGGEVSSVQRVKKEEAESKISAWQNAKISKINNRFKREDAVINGWEGEQVHKATSYMKKVERKLEDKRAKAMEKMQNEIAKSHRKAEERRASAEAKRGTKVAKVVEIANLMKAVGRAPPKRSFF